MVNAQMHNQGLLEKREIYSKERIDQLRSELSAIDQFVNFPKLTIFGAGSYGRLEASKYSDIDMFFLCSSSGDGIEEPNTKKILLFARIIELVERLGFPKLSNDCQFLKLLQMGEILQELGSPGDDYKNTFTARMLLLLESKCLYKDELYDETIKEIVSSYFRDYPQHSEDFKPIFLINDIARYWKTLCLNYEHKRNQPVDDTSRKVNQKVKNFKLKYSRMTTCFATIAAICCQIESITDQDIIRLVSLTPLQRLKSITTYLPESAEKIEKIIDQYEWFLEKTGLSTTELHLFFEESDSRKEMFEKANQYGDSMFDLLKFVDKKRNIFRYLVI